MPTTVNDRLVRGSDWSVGIADQAVYGVLDATPAFRPVRRSSGKPKIAIGYTQDDSVTTDNQGVQNIQDTKDYTMELAASFSKQSVDWLIKAVHGTEALITDTDITYAADVTGFVLDAAVYASVEVRDAFWISGFVDPSIDGFYIIASKDGGDHVTTTIAPAAAEVAGASVTFTSNKTTNGVTPTYSILQERVTDTSAVGSISYTTLYDAVIDTLSMEIGETGIVTSTANFVAEQRVEGVAAIAGQTYLAPLTDRSVSAVQDVTDWYVDGLLATCDQKSMTIETANGYTGDDAAACAKQYARGQFAVTGSTSFRARISDPLEWRTFYQNGTRKEMGVLITHPGGGNTFIVMPQIAVTEHDQANGGNDISNHEMSFGAEGSSVTSSTIAIFRDWV